MMTEKKTKQTTPKKEARGPKKLKDGSIKWGNKTWANEKEFLKYMDNVPMVDGIGKRKK